MRLTRLTTMMTKTTSTAKMMMMMRMILVTLMKMCRLLCCLILKKPLSTLSVVSSGRLRYGIAHHIDASHPLRLLISNPAKTGRS